MPLKPTTSNGHRFLVAAATLGWSYYYFFSIQTNPFIKSFAPDKKCEQIIICFVSLLYYTLLSDLFKKKSD